MIGIALSCLIPGIRIDLFRTRAATATKTELREEVVVLKWVGRNNLYKAVYKLSKELATC
jgi:hypothetical protein